MTIQFLLEPGKLQQHLQTDACEPSPTQLITLFLKNIPTIESKGLNELEEKLVNNYSDSDEVHIPPDSYEAKYRTKKAYALQTLAIKVASFLKWDLDAICNNLTIPIQYKLVQALTNACSSKNCPAEVKKFADIIYYHWFLRSTITYQLSSLQPQFNNTTIIYLSQLQQQQQAADSSALYSMGELLAPTSDQLKLCSIELYSFILEISQGKDNNAKKIKGVGHPFKRVKLSRPTMECFDPRDEQYNDWTKCELLESKGFIESACYDLGRFFFFVESYELAKQTFDFIKDSVGRFPKLSEYLKSATDLLDTKQNGVMQPISDTSDQLNDRQKIKDYLKKCEEEFKQSQKKGVKMEVEEGEIEDDSDFEEDTDLRFGQQRNQHRLPENSAWYLKVPEQIQQQQLLEAAKGDLFMSQGNFKQAMGCYVGTIMLMTDYFRFFTKNYQDEEPYISRMIQCSISLSCFTQAVALCQMTRSLNYTIAFKQLNERICNDCCDDIYECIWNVTLLEYIINLHSKRGEVERRTKVIQLLGQLELNENNPEEILREAEHVRRGRFFRIMSNKYL